MTNFLKRKGHDGLINYRNQPDEKKQQQQVSVRVNVTLAMVKTQDMTDKVKR